MRPAHLLVATLLALPSAAQEPTDWLERLEGPDADAAIESVAEQGKQAVPTLLTALDQDVETAWRAVRVFHAIGAKGASGTKELVARAVDTQRSDEQRTCAILSLAHVGPKAKKAAGPLVSVAAEKPVGMRHLATVHAWASMRDVRSLEKEVFRDDAITALLIATALANMEPPNKEAKAIFKDILDDERAYLLYPQAVRGLQDLKTGKKEVASARRRESTRIHCGILEPRAQTRQETMKSCMEAFSGVKESVRYSLPAQLWDFNEDKHFDGGELIQGLGRHFSEELVPLGEDLDGDRFEELSTLNEKAEPVLSLLHVLVQTFVNYPRHTHLWYRE